ncbi:hypothetical protein PQQ96_08615 [Paraburkholderia sediminicola]|uniref:hypothetical protein n=1 Tax=Paraburkholderia sediminicola TaxID=458836 RepID=UPI0038BDDD1F
MTTCSVMRGLSGEDTTLAASLAATPGDVATREWPISGEDGPLCCVSRLTGVSRRVSRYVAVLAVRLNTAAYF